MSLYQNSPVFLQPPPTDSAPAPTSTGTSAPSGGGKGPMGCDAMQTNIGMLVVMFAVFYFLLIRPQQKRAKEHDSLMNALRKGDKVRTNGGVAGEIVEIREREVILKIAEKTKINILRSHIAGREEEPKKDTK